MMRFAPGIALLVAAPVVYQALLGRRSVDDALLALLVSLVAVTVGIRVLQAVARSQAPKPSSGDGGDQVPPQSQPDR